MPPTIHSAPTFRRHACCPLRHFAFTLYGAPNNVAELEEVVAVMREKHLGNGLDPGPAAVASC